MYACAQNSIEMKPPILYFLIFLSSAVVAQPAFEIGTGVNYDYGVSLPRGTGYTPYGSGQTSLYGFEAYFSVPILNVFSLSPVYTYSLPSRTTPVSHPEGDFIPEGYSIKVDPGDIDEAPFYYNGPDYFILSSRAEIRQQRFGVYLSLHLGRDLRLGSGYLFRKRKTLIYDYMAFDMYYLFVSDEPAESSYLYEETYEYPGPSFVTEIRENRMAVPLFLTYQVQAGGGWYLGSSIIKWLNEPSALSFRFTTGLSF